MQITIITLQIITPKIGSFLGLISAFSKTCFKPLRNIKRKLTWNIVSNNTSIVILLNLSPKGVLVHIKLKIWTIIFIIEKIHATLRALFSLCISRKPIYKSPTPIVGNIYCNLNILNVAKVRANPHAMFFYCITTYISIIFTIWICRFINNTFLIKII